MGRIIAIANQKGGVGKTTTAINLAASLGVAEKTTLLIDIDPQGNATSGIGQDKGGVHTSVYNVLMGEKTLPEAVLPTAFRHLSLLPANIDLIGAEIEMVNLDRREWRLKEALTPVLDDYQYIVIDCPPSLSLLTVNALTAANSVIVPLQCEYYALEGLTQLMNTIELIRDSFNPALYLEGILLTMFNPSTNLSRQVAEEVRTHFAAVVCNSVIPRNVRLSEAPSFGKPVILYDARSKGAEAYLSFAQEIIANDQKSSGERAESSHPRQ